MSARVAVVGAGIIGMSAAWRLAQHGCHVTVFDQDAIGGEASWAGAGMLAPGGEIDSPCALADLCFESRRLYPAFVRELESEASLSIDYQECGGLDLAYSPEAAEALEARAARQENLGIVSKPISPAQLSAFWPRLETAGFAAARFYPGDAIVNPREVLAGLTAVCRNRGVSVLEHTPVRRIAISSHAATIETAVSSSPFDVCIVAAGAWSSGIPVDGVPALPAAEPVKGHLVGYRQPEQTCSTIVRHGHIYMLQRANGLLIAGASIEHAGFNRELDTEIVASLARAAGFLFPHLRETTISEAWVGFRPSSDELHIGPWHTHRLQLAYGHYRNGILLAPATTHRLLAAITQSAETDPVG